MGTITKIYRTILIVTVFSFLTACGMLDGVNKQEYYVGHTHFTYEGYSEGNVIDEGLQHLEIKFSSDVDLISVTVEVKYYDGSQLLTVTNKTNKLNYKANDQERIYVGVDYEEVAKKYTRIECSFSGYSHTKPSQGMNRESSTKQMYESHHVTFIYNNGNNNRLMKVDHNGILMEPPVPNKNNHIFDGWYQDQNYKITYNFSNKVQSDFKLYAKWNVDYPKLTNLITTSTMKSNIIVYNKCYNSFLGIKYKGQTHTGSGIIIHEQDGHYYALTNNHVTVKDRSYDKQEFEIIDYNGKSYKGKLLHQSSQYDLAVVYFKKDVELIVTPIAETNPLPDTEVISLGQPKGQTNAITFGRIEQYGSVTLNETKNYESNVTFPVIWHDAPTASGSSGGALLNTDLKLVGLHYAGSTDSSGQFKRGAAIPVEKINEFLRLYIYT